MGILHYIDFTRNATTGETIGSLTIEFDVKEYVNRSFDPSVFFDALLDDLAYVDEKFGDKNRPDTEG